MREKDCPTVTTTSGRPYSTVGEDRSCAATRRVGDDRSRRTVQTANTVGKFEQVGNHLIHRELAGSEGETACS